MDNKSLNQGNSAGNTTAFSRVTASKSLTRKQKALADYILANPKASGKEAVQHTYNVTTERSAEAIASRELRKAEMQAYLAGHAQIAQSTVLEVIAESKKHMTSGTKEGAAYAAVALNGSKDILDRVYGKPKQTTEVTSAVVSISLDLTSGAMGDVPQDVLRALEAS